MSRASGFASAQPLGDIVASLAEQVVLADAALQIGQQRRWNDLIQGRPLLAGCDRLNNLGLEEVRVDLRLAVVRRSWLRRLLDRKPRPREGIYRPALAHEKAAMEISVLIRRDANGRWLTTVGEDAQSPLIPRAAPKRAGRGP